MVVVVVVVVVVVSPLVLIVLQELAYYLSSTSQHFTDNHSAPLKSFSVYMSMYTYSICVPRSDILSRVLPIVGASPSPTPHFDFLCLNSYRNSFVCFDCCRNVILPNSCPPRSFHFISPRPLETLDNAVCCDQNERGYSGQSLACISLLDVCIHHDRLGAEND